MSDLPLIISAIILFIGGIAILALNIPFWSLLFGVASIQIGIVMIIIVFDYFIRRKTKPITDQYKTISCLVCQKITFVPRYAKAAICDDCQIKVARTFKAATLSVFALISMTTIVMLVSQNQDIREKAKAPTPSPVASELWSPSICRSGSWQEEKLCQGSEKLRQCGDNKQYCCKDSVEDGQVTWRCMPN